MGEHTPTRLDNRDERIRYIPLLLERGNLDDLPAYPLPAGYRFAFYQPGDEAAWVDIELSVNEVQSAAHGREVWARYYGAHVAELPGRMLFIEDARGEKLATASAYFDIDAPGPSDTGWLHWMAVRRDAQGRGLARPMIARTLTTLRELGYARARISTQTTTWVACRMYLDFGFQPTRESARGNRDGWRIVKALTDHPALRGFDAADTGLIYRA